MTSFEIGDTVNHVAWGNAVFEVRGVDEVNHKIWVRRLKGHDFLTFGIEYVTKVPLKFEPGKTYQWRTSMHHYYCVGVASNGDAYGYSWGEDPTSTEAWRNAYPRRDYTEVED